MAVGTPVTKQTIDGASGQLGVELELLMARIERFANYLAATPDVNLTALGYTAGEVATLKSAYVTDLLALIGIYRGTQNLTTARDFRDFLKQLWGTGL